MPTAALPWGAWYQDTICRLELPAGWNVDLLAPADASPRGAEEISAALESPIESPPVRNLAVGCRSACVVVDDLARPTRAGDVLEPLLRQLSEGGLSSEAVRIVVATGSHGALSEEQIRWKIGTEIASQCRVECHNCRDGLAGTGILYGKNELRINRTFLEADLKIAVGSVLPHSFAGNSGGAKLVLPGLADIDSTARSHKFVQLGLRGGSDPNENRFRREAEQLARQIGLKFIVCVLCDNKRQPTGIYAGDPVAAHRRACAASRVACRTELNATYDCAVLNAFPKDVDLVQAENAFVAWKTAKSAVVRDGGVVVLTTAASEGLGGHGLFEPGGVSYRPPVKKRALGERELWLYVPSLSTEDVHQLYWDGYPVFHELDRLREALADRFPDGANAAVFPCAPMQQVDDRRNSQNQ